ncbi:MAG: hypothetical protein IPI46_06125 [Bacteroidetes bacterium]|nr:hypothetical protein [Bacteroidota bacterium]
MALTIVLKVINVHLVSFKIKLNMKQILLLLLLLSLQITAIAQKKTPVEKAKAKTEEMQKDLQLTADQHKRVYDINLKAYQSIADYDAKDPGKKLKKKQKNIVQDLREAEYKRILTAAQYKKYLDLKKKEKAQKEKEAKELEKLKSKK